MRLTSTVVHIKRSVVADKINVHAGLLKPVSSLNASYTTNESTIIITVSWTPPFTLIGVPILAYNVTIMNTTGGNKETSLIENTNKNFFTCLPNSDTNFTITVFAINEVGPGEPAKVTMLLTSSFAGNLMHSTCIKLSHISPLL